MFDSEKWDVLCQDEKLVKKLAASLGTDEICAKLLINRGYTNVDEARKFIEKSDVFLYDPYLMKDMDKAVAVIEEAIDNEDKITIYGDYDVDGVTSVSVLYMYLKEHGARVDYHIPTRDGEGYGLNISAFDAINANGTNLVITVDTGITAIEEVAYAKSLGMKVVVTDHHQCRSEIPNADAVVNPKRNDCPYPFKELSGVGVVFKIICALELDYVNGGEYNLYTIKDMCRRYIDIVTIGTIADVMPLTGENRIIVHMGLGVLQNVRHVGVRALFRASGITDGSQKKITSSTISFTIAPKINAVGRIGSAERAVKLFLTDSPSGADVLAQELCAVNRDRQNMENIIYKDAFEKLETEYDEDSDRVIVLSSDKWHHGVIGIVASRLTEKFGVPSVLISSDGVVPDENGHIIGKGSVRSIKGVNIVEALASCADILPKFGGHALAAGLSVDIRNIPELKKRLNDYIKNVTKEMDVASKVTVDAIISPREITENTANAISLLEPYGAGNPIPLFAAFGVKISEMYELSGGKHTKLTLSGDGADISAVFFGTNLSDEGYIAGDEADVVGSIDINEFRGVKNVQFTVRDMDYSKRDKKRLTECLSEIRRALNDPSTVELENIPTRTDFIAVYNKLKELESSTLNFRAFAQKLGNFSYIKLAVVLEAFRQADIIEIHDYKNRMFMSTIKINTPEQKSDLSKTPIMTALKTNG